MSRNRFNLRHWASYWEGCFRILRQRTREALKYAEADRAHEFRMCNGPLFWGKWWTGCKILRFWRKISETYNCAPACSVGKHTIVRYLLLDKAISSFGRWRYQKLRSCDGETKRHKSSIILDNVALSHPSFLLFHNQICWLMLDID